ncbi:MAG: four helix bundle protein [Candidatus Viridilinea halotolerans]|uniref:Four helix bundle protein n=1 Tax=Candidatus Viridilinea halotolerans TaxID=2491704 RepID=A0A426TXA9_9CHLR|nr:MAG: four helix bundle protein [Candidatus Viridilinea halotolerans]
MKDEVPKPLRERTKAYALRIIKLYAALPRTTEAQVIGRQLLRSGTSVGANYREGYRARSSAEMAAKFGISIQELDETAYWIELLIEADSVAEPLVAPLLDETNQLIAIFTTSVRKLRQKGKGDGTTT